jgi:hypothetical protein
MTLDRIEGFTLSPKILAGLDEVDAMPRGLRECVHEFGLETVRDFLARGVRKPDDIRFLVHSAWCGARGPWQRMKGDGSGSSYVLRQLDWLLIQAGAQINAKALLRLLWGSAMVIITRDPSTHMLDASLHYTDTAGPLSKTSKHRGRLRAAIEAGAKNLWPFLFTEKR